MRTKSIKAISFVSLGVAILVAFIYLSKPPQKPEGQIGNENENMTFDSRSEKYGANFYDIENEQVVI